MAPDKVPSSGIGAACQFHKEQYLHSAFSILFCPRLTALQILLSERQILLEKHHQLSFQGCREYLFVRTEFCRFPFEKLEVSISFTFRQRFPEA